MVPAPLPRAWSGRERASFGEHRCAGPSAVHGVFNDLTTISMHLTVSRLPRRGRVSPTHGATHCIASHRIQIGPLQSLSASGMDHRERT